jgi:hypothetical protein
MPSAESATTASPRHSTDRFSPGAIKYVGIREHAGLGLTTAVLCFAPITHRELAGKFTKTHVPVSAGFVEFLADGRVRTFGWSESLALSPAAGDGPLIESLMRATRIASPAPARR